MAPAYEFDDFELIRDLRAYGPRQLRQYYQRRDKLAVLIHCAVGGCTFRAFSGLDLGPSRIFRPWAHRYLTKERTRELADAQTQEEFDQFLESMHQSLAEDWRVIGGKELGYGPGMKLLNLLMKSVLRSRRFSRVERQRLIPLLHVPLDKFSLAAIRRFSRSGEYGPVVRIRAKPRMGDMTSREVYAAVQAIMRAVADEADVPPICIDLLAWDMAHN